MVVVVVVSLTTQFWSDYCYCLHVCLCVNNLTTTSSSSPLSLDDYGIWPKNYKMFSVNPQGSLLENRT